MAVITSLTNSKVKYARSLQRRRHRDREAHFLIEGLRLLEDAIRAGCDPALLFYEPEQLQGNDRAQAMLETARQRSVPCQPVSKAVLESLSDTETPQGIVGVMPEPHPSPPAEIALLLVVDRVRDPGNLGTLLRTAAAGGVDEVLLAPGTVDPYNSKVVRAGMGAHFRLPIAKGMAWPEIADRLKGLAVWLADANGAQTYDEVDWTSPVALIVGGEAQGGSRQARAVAQGQVRIPMHGDTESLNAAVAAAIILFEATRQRRRRLRPG